MITTMLVILIAGLIKKDKIKMNPTTFLRLITWITILFVLIGAPLIVNAQANIDQPYVYHLPIVSNGPVSQLPECNEPITNVSVSGSELFVEVSIACHGGTYSDRLNPQVEIVDQTVNWITISLCIPGGSCQYGESVPGNQTGDYVMISDYNQDTTVTDFTLWYDEIMRSYDYTPAAMVEDVILYEDGSAVLTLCIEAFNDTCQ